MPDGPIPGENYTSDTKQYPWHRPPEHTDLDEAIESCVEKLTDREVSNSLLIMLQSGISVVQAADIFVTSGVAKGKWTVDMSLLLVGPVSHMMKIMAEGSKIKYEMGLEDGPLQGIDFLKHASKIDPRRAVKAVNELKQSTDKIKENASQQTKPGQGSAPNQVTPQQEGGAGSPPPGMGQFMGGSE